MNNQVAIRAGGTGGGGGGVGDCGGGGGGSGGGGGAGVSLNLKSLGRFILETRRTSFCFLRLPVNNATLPPTPPPPTPPPPLPPPQPLMPPHVLFAFSIESFQLFLIEGQHYFPPISFIPRPHVSVLTISLTQILLR